MEYASEGTYVLKINLEEEREMKVGSLPAARYEGSYLYVGSALGSGGFKRVARHLEISRGERSGGHWHVDYLLEAGRVNEIWMLPTGEDLECGLARRLGEILEEPVEGFGASDCDCYSHLFSIAEGEERDVHRVVIDFSPVRPIHFEPE